jgi:hypothetical protein
MRERLVQRHIAVRNVFKTMLSRTEYLNARSARDFPELNGVKATIVKFDALHDFPLHLDFFATACQMQQDICNT